jgi:uncharacterized integral membrane protein
MTTWLQETGEIYQGQFGEFTVTRDDRKGVVIYRTALAMAAAAFGLGTMLILNASNLAAVVPMLTPLFVLFGIALGISLWTIHIYLKPLHIALKLFWSVGCATALGIIFLQPHPLGTALYPPFAVGLIGVGCIFVALTGLFIKEAFCFNRWQAKLLAIIVPILLTGHWFGWLPLALEKGLLSVWAITFAWFAVDKLTQPIPPDIGDKTVFEYLKRNSSVKPKAS